MRKKIKPTELEASLKDQNREASKPKQPQNPKMDSGQVTQKKAHRKMLSIPESYYFVKVYKNTGGEKSKGTFL
jgi:hypothetical protein